MLKSDVFKFYGGGDYVQAKVASILGITRQAVKDWPDRVPMSSAQILENITGGRLKVDRSLYYDKEGKRIRKNKKKPHVSGCV